MKYLFFILLCFCCNSIQSQWSPTYGPYGARVLSSTVNGTKLYACTYNGLYVTADNGLNWTNMGISTMVTSVAFKDTRIFAGTTSGILISDDNGLSWNMSRSGLSSTNIQSLGVMGNRIFAGTYDRLNYSTDNGNTWSVINTGMNLFEQVNTILINGSAIMAGSQGHGVYLSTDSGANWNSVSVGLNYPIHSLVYNGSSYFAGTEFGIFNSVNGGTSWNDISNSLPNIDIRAIAFSGSTIIAGTWADGIYLSTDNGLNWQAGSTGLTSNYVSTLSVIGSQVFAGTNALISGMFGSSNKGASWTPLNNGINNTIVRTLTSLHSTVFSGTYAGGVYFSSNQGASWNLSNSGITNFAVLSSSTDGTNVYMGTEAGVFMSGDNGVTWTDANNGIVPSNGVRAFTRNGSEMYCATYNSVYKSVNNGGNWSLSNSGLSKPVLALASGGSNIYAGSTLGVFLSKNNGSSWNEVSSASLKTQVNAMALMGAKIIAATRDSGVFYSYDTCKTWIKSNSGLPQYLNIKAMEIFGSTVFIGTSSGFYYTKDLQIWRQANIGLQNTDILSLNICKDYIYAGTNGSGVWKCSLSNLIEGLNSQLSNQKTLQISPNPVSGICTLRSSNNISKIILCNYLGQVVQELNPSISMNETAINLSNYKAGYYFVLCYFEDQSTVIEKLIIHK